jgi:hypothetical protein
MSTFSHEALQNMTDEQFHAACDRADAQNQAAEQKLRRRADHIRDGGVTCFHCGEPVMDEKAYLCAIRGTVKPACSAECAAESLKEQLLIAANKGPVYAGFSQAAFRGPFR